MSKIFVLVDFENVQPASIAALADARFHLLVFVGASQNKLPTDIVIGMQAMGPRAEYVRASGSGRNALDFHIAFYLGKLATANPDAAFQVISRDQGFDPLIAFMKAGGRSVERRASLDGASSGRAGAATPKSTAVAKPAAPAPKAGKPDAATPKRANAPTKPAPAKPIAKKQAPAVANAAPPPTSPASAARVDDYLAVFDKPTATRPKSEATLASSIRTHFGKNLAAKDVAEVIRGLVARGFVTITGGKVSYRKS